MMKIKLFFLGFFLTPKFPSYRINHRLALKNNLGLFVVLILAVGLIPVAGHSTPVDEFENNKVVPSAELLDNTAMEVLVGSKESSDAVTPPMQSVGDGSSEEALNLQLTPGIEGVNPGGFEEKVDWVDFEDIPETGENMDSQMEQILEDGLLPEGLEKPGEKVRPQPENVPAKDDRNPKGSIDGRSSEGVLPEPGGGLKSGDL